MTEPSRPTDEPVPAGTEAEAPPVAPPDRKPRKERKAKPQPGLTVGHSALAGLAVGRIVHYVLPEGPQAGAHRAAIVTLSSKSGKVNMQVFVNRSDFVKGAWPGGQLMLEGVTFDDARSPGTWHWPETD